MGCAEKIRVFIVDDEIMSVNYIKNMIAEAGDALEIVGCALSADEALRAIPAARPDVVVADINMPGMTGLEMIERLQSRQDEDTIFLLLTAYQDFDYAKRGIELRVGAYLLKHEVTAQTLRAECQRQVALRAERRRRQHFFRAQSLLQFLETPGESVPQILPDGGENSAYFLLFAVLHRSVAWGEAERRTSFDPFLLESDCPLPSLRCVVCIPVDEDSFCIIYKRTEPAGRHRQERLDVAVQARNAFHDAGISVSLYVSRLFASPADLPGWYAGAKGFARGAFCREEQLVLLRETPSFPPIGFFETRISPFVQTLQNASPEAVCSSLRALLHEASAALSIARYESFLASLLRAVNGFFRSAGIPGLNERLDPPPPPFRTQGELERWFENYIAQMLERMELCGVGIASSPKITDALRHIHDHYAENLSIGDLAQSVSLSEGHLRKLFKNEIGMTIVDYLTDYRIERAKEKLSTGKYRITDVYREVGFTSSQYFSSVFKRKTGCSPNDFLRRQR